ncbi:hypothetical protein SCOR_13440 [Sulfidibacter corallicola]|uniref:Uncharacterized protein n=1 Tax=Sulfidibacter corallicola TaxID=2818388 RepID=A0A8A4TDM9_SULCO|nr:hypothetical protein [Sulfidibacter corallicola]QTD47677.1 hypothetical protein J3U87_18960 [Sulfidibacter corallicola]
MDRRQFLKLGVTGGALLTMSAWMSKGTFWGTGTHLARRGNYQYQFLTEADHEVVSALIPAILAGTAAARDKELAEEVVRGVDIAASHFRPAIQKEIRQLFTVLTLPATRVLACGVWSGWSQADPARVEGFLASWRNSRMALLRSGYDALQQLTVASWYGNPKSWSGLGYEGPPPLANA